MKTMAPSGGYREIAEAMTPEDRAHMIAIADGFGRMLLAIHRPESEAFAARYPGVATTHDGYVKIGGDRWVGRTRWFSIQATMLGLQVARMIERFDMPVSWPENDAEAA